MNDKRFVLCKKGDVEYIEDNGCVQLYGFDVLCEMLNELNDENKELKLQLEAFKYKLCELGVSDVNCMGKDIILD